MSSVLARKGGNRPWLSAVESFTSLNMRSTYIGVRHFAEGKDRFSLGAFEFTCARRFPPRVTTGGSDIPSGTNWIRRRGKKCSMIYATVMEG